MNIWPGFIASYTENLLQAIIYMICPVSIVLLFSVGRALSKKPPFSAGSDLLITLFSITLISGFYTLSIWPLLNYKVGFIIKVILFFTALILLLLFFLLTNPIERQLTNLYIERKIEQQLENLNCERGYEGKYSLPKQIKYTVLSLLSWSVIIVITYFEVQFYILVSYMGGE